MATDKFYYDPFTLDYEEYDEEMLEESEVLEESFIIEQPLVLSPHLQASPNEIVRASPPRNRARYRKSEWAFLVAVTCSLGGILAYLRRGGGFAAGGEGGPHLCRIHKAADASCLTLGSTS